MFALPHADPGTPDLASPRRFLTRVARLQINILGVAVVWGIVWMGAQAAVPAALGRGVQSIADGDLRSTWTWAGLVLLLGLVQSVAGIMRHRYAVRNWLSAAARVQQWLARHASALGADLPRQVATGEVVAVSANDVERIGNALDVVARFVGSIVAFVGVAVVLMLSSPLLGAVVVVGAPVVALAIGPLVRPLERRERAQRARLGEATSLAADTVAGLRVLRGIGGEDLFVQRYHDASDRVRRAAIETARVRSTLDALQVLLPGLFVVLVTWLGAGLALQGRITAGQLVAFYGYTAFLVLPLRTITETAHKWTAARVAAGRITTILALTRAVPDDGTASAPAPGVPLVDPASGLAVPAGALTVVVSDDPEQADALADRLGRYAPTDATLDGTPLTALPLATVRQRVLVQDKDPMILAGPVRDLFAVPSSGRVAVDDAVHAASAEDVFDGLPEGPDTVLPERGRSLSGGQRQRLALARSLVADPEVLVLDEPTSAVDAHTEARIAERLRELRAGRTTVVLATSPLLLERADHVVFLRDGVVAARGRHHDLLRDDAGYRDVVARGG